MLEEKQLHIQQIAQLEATIKVQQAEQQEASVKQEDLLKNTTRLEEELKLAQQNHATAVSTSAADTAAKEAEIVAIAQQLKESQDMLSAQKTATQEAQTALQELSQIRDGLQQEVQMKNDQITNTDARLHQAELDLTHANATIQDAESTASKQIDEINKLQEELMKTKT